MHVEVRRNIRFDRVEELAKLHAAVAVMTFADDRAGFTSSAATSDVVPWRR